MVARTPPKQRKMVDPLNPTLLRETVDKVDRCMARLQELQYTVAGGRKVISGVSLSPRSTRGYLKTSLRCKQESLRIKNTNPRTSPPGKLPTKSSPGELPTNTGMWIVKIGDCVLSSLNQLAVGNLETGEWRRMSLPAMLLGETVAEILKSSQFARQIVQAVAPPAPNIPKPTSSDDPKTPLTLKKNRNQKPNQENPELRSRRKREKQSALQSIRSESTSPSSLQRGRSRRINFKVSSSPPVRNRETEKENCRYIANRVSPKNRPWARKTVLFPNPLFHSSPTSQHQKFCRTKSPVIAKSRQTPHKFLIKSPNALAPPSSKFQVKIKGPQLSVSPTKRNVGSGRKSSPVAAAADRLRRSFSPSKLASRLVSPLKGRKPARKSFDGNGMMMMMSGLKQRPSSTPMQFSARRK
ncbi:hypothetical protein RJ640_024796 [Escallonia rubra]|uniref:Microtubule-binding protein TANGLED n=1 Tax=Escallonia rubra TaxID=112253 RepID=A0AA88QTL5_9ASTE|nr:hypothetical protein RJ640_024796 [Escallonia rubra]